MARTKKELKDNLRLKYMEAAHGSLKQNGAPRGRRGRQ